MLDPVLASSPRSHWYIFEGGRTTRNEPSHTVLIQQLFILGSFVDLQAA